MCEYEYEYVHDLWITQSYTNATYKCSHVEHAKFFHVQSIYKYKHMNERVYIQYIYTYAYMQCDRNAAKAEVAATD